MTDFEFPSIIRGTNPPAQENGYITERAAPEILRGTGAITREADVFAFGIVVVEVGLHAVPHLVLEVEVRLTFEWYLRLLWEGVHSTNSQPRSLLRRSSMANDQLVRRGRKN